MCVKVDSKSLEKYIREYLSIKGVDIETEIKHLQKQRAYFGENLTYDEAVEELVCNALSDIATDEKALEAFLGLEKSEQNKIISIIKEIAKRLKEWAQKVFANTPYHSALIKDSEALVTLANKLRAELKTSAQKNNTAKDSGVRYDVRIEFASELQKWFDSTTSKERKGSGKRFLVGSTSEVLKSIGVKDYNIYFGGSKIEKILSKHKDMTLETIKQAVNMLESPMLIMESATVKGSIVLFGDVYTDKGRPVMISVLLNPKSKNGEILDYAFITSAYDRSKENLQNLIYNSRINYVSKDKNRTDKWLKALGLQLPSALTKYGSIHNISDYIENVNKKHNSIEELDEAYLSAIENSDMKTAQKLVDEAANNKLKDSQSRTENGLSKLDSTKEIKDNKDINNGGAENGSQNTELLEQGTVSAFSGGYDSVWEQSESAREILGYLGIFDGNEAQKKAGIGTTDSRWLAANAFQQQIEKGFNDGVLRDLRGVKLSGKDVIGRVLSKQQIAELKDTIFKDDSGNILSLYHWTPNVFSTFKYGDIGFHFGTVFAAHERYEMLKEESAYQGKEISIGIYKEVYLNVSKPIYMPDLGQWTAYDISVNLERNGLITELQYNRLSMTEGFYDLSYDNPAINAVRKILTNLGYDGIVYYNDTEDTKSISAIALYPEQVIMVTDNGVPVNNDDNKKSYSFGEEDLDFGLYLSGASPRVEQLKNSNHAFGEMLSKTKNIHLEREEIESAINGQLKYYGIKGDTTEAKARISEIIEHTEKEGIVNGDAVMGEVAAVVKDSIMKSEYTQDPYESERKDVFKIMRSFGKVYLSPDQVSELKVYFKIKRGGLLKPPTL